MGRERQEKAMKRVCRCYKGWTIRLRKEYASEE